MLKIKKGDLLKANVDIIGHQCNCQGSMGAGIAKQIANKFPNVENEYKKLCNSKKPEELLGTCQVVQTYDQSVANLFGQNRYGRGKRQTDYKALRKSLEELRDNYPDQIIGLPYGIGCGLAGGKWEIVKQLIEITFDDEQVVIYKL